MAESARKSSPVHARLAEVKWRPPSCPPDTSGVDDDWSDVVAPRSPRQSFIGLKTPRSLPVPRRAVLPSPPSVAPARAMTSLVPPAPSTNELAYDVWHGPTAILVLVDLPGVDAEHVSLTLGSHALYLELHVPSEVQRPGIATGRYSLTVELPSGLAADAIDASLAQGLLRVRITTGGVGPRRVAIRSAE